MISISSFSDSAMSKTKRVRSLLVTLPLTLVLISCDNTSSTSPEVNDNNANSEASSTDVAPNANEPRSENTTLTDQTAETISDDKSVSSEEGQSLISAAKTDNNAYNQRSTTSRTDGMLQATLMGDYGGMLPCSSCDNIDVTLNLFADGSVTKTSIYKNAQPSKGPYVESGIYRQDVDKITIVYQKKHVETYLIQDNHLIMLDEANEPDDDYTLSRK